MKRTRQPAMTPDTTEFERRPASVRLIALSERRHRRNYRKKRRQISNGVREVAQSPAAAASRQTPSP